MDWCLPCYVIYTDWTMMLSSSYKETEVYKGWRKSWVWYSWGQETVVGGWSWSCCCCHNDSCTIFTLYKLISSSWCQWSSRINLRCLPCLSSCYSWAGQSVSILFFLSMIFLSSTFEGQVKERKQRYSEGTKPSIKVKGSHHNTCLYNNRMYLIMNWEIEAEAERQEH